MPMLIRTTPQFKLFQEEKNRSNVELEWQYLIFLSTAQRDLLVHEFE